MKKEEDCGGPAMRTRGSKRKIEDELSHDNLAADTGIDRKMKKEEDNGEPAMRTRGSKRKTEEGRRKETNGGRLPQRSRGNKRKKNHEEKPAQDGLQSSSQSGWKLLLSDVVSRCPDLVQDKIFELLSLRDKVRVAQVCSSWRDAVYRPCHWKGLTVKVKKPEEVISTLKARQINRVKLNAPCNNVKKFLVEFNTVEWLDLSFMNSAALLGSLSGERFESLRELFLGIENRRQMYRLKSCLKCFPNLVVLSVTGAVSACLLEAIGDQLKSLERLDLFRDLSSGVKLNLEALGHLKRLQDLYLDGFQLEGTEILIQLSSTLRRLILCRCGILVDWTPVLSQQWSLNELQIVDCQPVVDSNGLRALAQALPNLTKFVCGNDSVIQFAIPEQDWVSDDHMSAVAEMSGLQEVQVLYDTLITDTGVLALCAKLHNLRVLNVCECERITSKSIEHISKLSSLRELSLRSSLDGTNWLKILAQESCKLRKLKLSAFATSDEGMKHIAQMSSLCNLILREVSMGAAGMAHLSKATFHLESLEMIYCGATVKGLTPLLQMQATSLQKLTLVEKKKRQGLKFLI